MNRTASALVKSDDNGASDVFAIRRTGHFGNNGSVWSRGKTILISRGRHGHSANGPSFAPSVDGNYRTSPKCVAFLSAASNLVTHDRNDVVDAFVSRGPGHSIQRVSFPGGHEAKQATTDVAVSGDCTHVAFVTGGRLFDNNLGHIKWIHTRGNASDPSFAAGEGNDLVFAARGGVYLSRNGMHHPHNIADGRNPAYNGLRRHVVAYEAHRHG